MAITAAVCNSYKGDQLAGVHTSSDTDKIALYVAAATLDATTTAYSATNEASGTGYTAGGQTLAGFTIGNSGGTYWIDWTTDPVWSSSSITARGALIYNSTRSNKAVCVLDFGADIVSTGGPFTVEFPAAASSTALLRVS